MQQSNPNNPEQTWQMPVGVILYGLISLEAYMSLGILLPWLLPALTVWLYHYSYQKHLLPPTP